MGRFLTLHLVSLIGEAGALGSLISLSNLYSVGLSSVQGVRRGFVHLWHVLELLALVDFFESASSASD